jgi:hypothetical protein
VILVGQVSDLPVRPPLEAVSQFVVSSFLGVRDSGNRQFGELPHEIYD